MKDALTPEQREQFLEEIAERPLLQEAALKIGVRFGTLQRYLLWASENDKAFYERFETAQELSRKVVVDDEITRRGVYGVEEVVLHQGSVVYVEGDDGPTPLKKINYSDKLLADLAKAVSPEKYGDKVEVDHKNAGGAVVVVASDAELIEMRQRLKEAAKKREAEESGNSA